MAVSKVSIKVQLLLMDQISVRTHKSNYDDKTAQFNLEAVKIIKFSSGASPRVLAGDGDARVVLSDLVSPQLRGHMRGIGCQL